jgi:hypothetical protein
MNDRNKSIASSWMSRRSTPAAAAPAPQAAYRPVGGHAVIWAKLPNWHSYGNWVDKCRNKL